MWNTLGYDKILSKKKKTIIVRFENTSARRVFPECGTVRVRYGLANIN